jgi:hypothetical protein
MILEESNLSLGQGLYQKLEFTLNMVIILKHIILQIEERGIPSNQGQSAI